MRAFAAVFTREVFERRMVFLVAFASGFVPLVGSPRNGWSKPDAAEGRVLVALVGGRGALRRIRAPLRSGPSSRARRRRSESRSSSPGRSPRRRSGPASSSRRSSVLASRRCSSRSRPAGSRDTPAHATSGASSAASGCRAGPRRARSAVRLRPRRATRCDGRAPALAVGRAGPDPCAGARLPRGGLPPHPRAQCRPGLLRGAGDPVDARGPRARGSRLPSRSSSPASLRSPRAGQTRAGRTGRSRWSSSELSALAVADPRRLHVVVRFREGGGPVSGLGRNPAGATGLLVAVSADRWAPGAGAGAFLFESAERPVDPGPLVGRRLLAGRQARRLGRRTIRILREGRDRADIVLADLATGRAVADRASSARAPGPTSLSPQTESGSPSGTSKTLAVFDVSNPENPKQTRRLPGATARSRWRSSTTTRCAYFPRTSNARTRRGLARERTSRSRRSPCPRRSPSSPAASTARRSPTCA